MDHCKRTFRRVRQVVSHFLQRSHFVFWVVHGEREMPESVTRSSNRGRKWHSLLDVIHSHFYIAIRKRVSNTQHISALKHRLINTSTQCVSHSISASTRQIFPCDPHIHPTDRERRTFSIHVLDKISRPRKWNDRKFVHRSPRNTKAVRSNSLRQFKHWATTWRSRIAMRSILKLFTWKTCSNTPIEIEFRFSVNNVLWTLSQFLSGSLKLAMMYC